MKGFCRDTWVEVDLDAIRKNVQSLSNHLPASTSIMAIVKADGYGHGSVQVAQEALASGAKELGVSMLEEAIVLRNAGITAPILVLGYTPIDSIELACEQNIQLTAYHPEWVAQADSLLGQKESAQVHARLGIHIKLDTGMGRLGIRQDSELFAMINSIQHSEFIEWSGIYTHFACADEEDTSHVREQHDRFQSMLRVVKEAGYKLPKVHCCNSAAAMAFPEWGYDMVRFGIGLYGLYPSTYIKEQEIISLQPALQLKTKIVHVKRPSQAYTVSYGATYEAKAEEQVATLPIGYADGFSRLLSNRGCVLHRGLRVPVVGRVCMDQIMVRIDNEEANVGDEIVIYGRQGDEEISLDEVGQLLGTINYEVSCMLNYRLPRVYLREGRVVEICHRINNKC
ncbi:alanine racemase [Brevibacillus sp. SYSU BS000544]|uniref:alanine racemase n=1 Tax=Brevibacillus sp. SYSU BS000544 TaxID=3416443 RepID=UPI003CE48CF8